MLRLPSAFQWTNLMWFYSGVRKWCFITWTIHMCICFIDIRLQITSLVSSSCSYTYNSVKFSTGQRYTCLFVRGLHLPKGNQNPYIEEQITPCVYALWMYGFRLPLWDLQTFHTHVILLNCLQDRDTLVSVEVWRYRRGNHNPYIEEEQTIPWSTKKVEKEKQRSTRHTHKTKDRVTQTPRSGVSSVIKQ